MKKVLAVGSITAMVLFNSCGGGSSHSGGFATGERETSDTLFPYQGSQPNESSSSYIGYLVDSPVKGATYSCGTKLALTDVNGKFECETLPVSFKVGKIELGSVSTIPADQKVYPQDIIGVSRSNIDNSMVVAIAVILQSLDSDYNPSNGISISVEQAMKFIETIFIATSTLDEIKIKMFEQDSSVVFKSEEEAKAHLKDSIEGGSQIDEEVDISCASTMIQNSWMENTSCTSGENYSRIWTFESDKTFYNDSYTYPNSTWECLNDELILSFSGDDGVSTYRLPYQSDMSFAYTSSNCVTTMNVTQNTSDDPTQCDPLSELMGICNTTTEPTTPPSSTPTTTPSTTPTECDPLSELMGVCSTTGSSNNAPIVDAGDDRSVVINTTITLKGVAIDPEEESVSYEWSKGATVLSTQSSFEYTPTTEGLHTLSFKATDAQGASASDTINVNVTTSTQDTECDPLSELMGVCSSDGNGTTEPTPTPTPEPTECDPLSELMGVCSSDGNGTTEPTPTETTECDPLSQIIGACDGNGTTEPTPTPTPTPTPDPVENNETNTTDECDPLSKLLGVC